MWMIRRASGWRRQRRFTAQARLAHVTRALLLSGGASGYGRRRTARRRGAARGQALVEFALIFPLIMFLVVGATDVSTLLDNHLDVVYAARTGARVGSILGTAPASDCAIIGAIRAAISPVRGLQLTRIDIYQANASGLPNGTNQDIYAGNSVCNPDTSITPGAQSVGWPPSVRNTSPITEDSIGVELDFNYTFQFNLLGIGTFSAADRAVMPMEVVIGTPVAPSS